MDFKICHLTPRIFLKLKFNILWQNITKKINWMLVPMLNEVKIEYILYIPRSLNPNNNLTPLITFIIFNLLAIFIKLSPCEWLTFYHVALLKLFKLHCFIVNCLAADRALALDNLEPQSPSRPFIWPKYITPSWQK